MTTNNLDLEPEDRREKVTLQQKGGFEHQVRVMEDVGAERQLLIARLTRFLSLVFAILESLIGLRILLKLMPANPSNLFAQFIYQMTDLFLRPFASLVGNPAGGGRVLELTSLVAILVYALIGWVMIQLVRLVLFRTRTRTVAIYNKERQ
jgi:YggT family protein